MMYLQLYFEFFKIGLFAIGGGLATVPFLQRLGEATGWFDSSLITDMIAISESTPGPIGVNMATYVGYSIGGIPGGIIATLGIATPAFLIVVLVSKSLERFKGNHYIEDGFYGLRPAVTGMIAAAAIGIMEVSIFNYQLFQQTGLWTDFFDGKKLIFFVIMFFAIMKWKKHPIFYIGISAVIGILLKF